MHLRLTRLLRKQTKCPPKNVIPLQDNPLTRWSLRLPQTWTSDGNPALPHLAVGLEGCENAFNATNAIRTCWHFRTSVPPTFLSLSKWEDIQHLQQRCASRETGDSAEAEDEFVKEKANGVALFGESQFFTPEWDKSKPIVVLENFSDRAQSVFRRRVPSHSRVVVGHENRGVRASLLDAAEATPSPTEVIYIPQYGTISSLNVVTALGIGLFYALLDQHYPQARKLEAEHLSESEKQRFASLLKYQHHFSSPLPMTRLDETSASTREDSRPVHPVFYKKTEQSIVADLQHHRQQLLALSHEGNASPFLHRFGISLLYENEFDQRNFGGLIRNANAFLVDKVCYVGRKKYNVIGSVGSYHYTPPHYLGAGFEADQENMSEGGELEVSVKKALSGYPEATAHQSRIIKLACWSLQLRNEVAKVCGGPSQFWLLDCGHQAFYAEDFALQQQELRDRKAKGQSEENIGEGTPRSSLESLRWFLTHYSDDEFLLSLCDTEEMIRAAAGIGVVLVVPQEGKLPHISILTQCNRIVTMTPPSLRKESLKRMTGIPSQVASGIALQRLSAILHPKLCQL